MQPLRNPKPVKTKFFKLSSGRTVFNFENEGKITCEGLTLAQGSGVLTVKTNQDLKVKLDTDGKVHVYPRAVSYRAPTPEDTFATLDRPPPLSPEMEAIQRLSRQNSIRQEQQRLEMETRLALIARDARRSQEQDSPTASKTLREGNMGSTDDPEDGTFPSEDAEVPNDEGTSSEKGTKKGARRTAETGDTPAGDSK